MFINNTMTAFVGVLNVTTSTIATNQSNHGSTFNKDNKVEMYGIALCYSIGVIGNLAALILLCRKSLRSTNPRHNFILKCLVANDLTALMGMQMCMMVSQYYSLTDSIWMCRARVIMRVFGMGSGCVAIVMAIERCLALTKPFYYQKHVTLKKLRCWITVLWTFSLILVCMPLLGFGQYFDYNSNKCINFKFAESTSNRIYAWLYFVVGIILCGGIVYCNIQVIRSLCFKGCTYATANSSRNHLQGALIRHMSRTFSKMSTASTREEKDFGWLMGILCVVYLVCWMPQLLTIPISILLPRPRDENNTTPGFCRITEIILAAHLALDPYIYVFQRSTTVRRVLCGKKDTAYSEHGSSIRS